MGIGLSFANFASVYAYHALDTNPGSLPGGAAVEVLAEALWLPELAFTTIFLFLWFPAA